MSIRRPKSPHLRLVQPAEPEVDGAGAGHSINEPPSLEQAYRSYAPYVAAIALRILGRDGELDDLVQDVFLDAARGLSNLREPAAIKGWLARITVRTAVRRLRQRKLRRVLLWERDASAYDTLASEAASPEERAAVAGIYRALDRLPAEERAAWVLRHVQGESLEDGAAAMGCSLSTYQRRLRRAAQRLHFSLGRGSVIS